MDQLLFAHAVVGVAALGFIVMVIVAIVLSVLDWAKRRFYQSPAGNFQACLPVDLQEVVNPHTKR